MKDLEGFRAKDKLIGSGRVTKCAIARGGVLHTIDFELFVFFFK